MLHNLLYESLCIAVRAGKIIMRFHGDRAHTTKEDKSPLTQADLESNAYITKKLDSISPYKVCSEEAVLAYNERKSVEYFWLIDPLDGTKDFLEGNGNFTINIALMRGDKPILGVVYAPCLYEAYIALHGFGSFGYNIAAFKEFASTLGDTLEDKTAQKTWLETHKIPLKKENATQIYGINLESLSNVDSILREQILQNLHSKKSADSNKWLIACDSLFHSTQKTQDFIEKYNALTLKRGSSLKLCALACGIADIYPRMNGTSEWDTAAGDIILQESGGIMIDIETKKPLCYNKESMRNNHFIAFSRDLCSGDIYAEYATS